MKFKSNILSIVIYLLLFVNSAWGDSKYSIRLAYGVESDSDLGEILTFQKPTAKKYDFNVIALDGGYLLKPSLYDMPLDLYLKGGVALFRSENLSKYPKLQGMRDLSDKNVYEFTLYVKLYYNIDFLNNRMRIGLGEGGSYVTDYLAPEVIEEHTETPTHPKYAKFLNYLDISLDIDLGKLFHTESLKKTYIGYTLKHRSGIFGLINGVSGGSNYNTISIERNF